MEFQTPSCPGEEVGWTRYEVRITTIRTSSIVPLLDASVLNEDTKHGALSFFAFNLYSST